MRIIRCFVLMAIFCSFGALSASAQTGAMVGKFAVAPIIGVSSPIQYMKAGLDEGGGGGTIGFAVGASGEYFLSEDITVGAKVMFDRFGMDTDVPGFPSDASGNWTIIEGGVFARYMFTPGMPTQPFVRAGVLMGKPKAKQESGSTEVEYDIPLTFGGELGGGVLHQIQPNLSVFGELNWTGFLTDGKEVERSVNGTLVNTFEQQKHIQWVGIKAGVLFFFGGA